LIKEKTMKKSFSIILMALCIIGFGGYASADYAAGVAAYKKQHYRECIDQLQAYTDKTLDTRAFYLMGYASYKLRDYEKSKEYFRKAYVLEPNFRPASLHLKQ
jgi:tetratricopeptide (TPR) repeat protein